MLHLLFHLECQCHWSENICKTFCCLCCLNLTLCKGKRGDPDAKTRQDHWWLFWFSYDFEARCWTSTGSVLLWLLTTFDCKIPEASQSRCDWNCWLATSPWNHKIGWDLHSRIIGIIGQTGEIFGTSVSQMADLQLLVRCSRHKTPAAWLHTVAHRWDDTEMTQRWDNIRTTSEQHGNTGFARSLPPNLQFPRCFHSFKLRLYMYLINSNIDII